VHAYRRDTAWGCTMWEAGWGSFACFTCFACCVFQYRYILYNDHQDGGVAPDAFNRQKGSCKMVHASAATSAPPVAGCLTAYHSVLLQLGYM
jgi:hypothetical protein